MSRPLLLDLFCGAGGAARGYYDAGFDVVGVDLLPQPRYPYTFIQADALDVLNMLLSEQGLWQSYALDDFATIHASPPCQEYSVTRYLRNARAVQTNREIRYAAKLLPVVRQRLEETCLPFVIENVAHSPLLDALELCGSMFGLQVRRHRWFSCSHLLYAPGSCRHTDGFYNPVGNKVRGYGTLASKTLYKDAKGRMRKREGFYRLEVGKAAMGIDWPVTMHELSQAIPPAYTRFIGNQLMAILESSVV